MVSTCPGRASFGRLARPWYRTGVRAVTRPKFLATAAAILAVSLACSGLPPEPPRLVPVEPLALPPNPCAAQFTKCAPPVTFARDTPVSGLSASRLFEVSLRMDVPDRLSAEAASRLRTLCENAELAALLELKAARDDAWNALAKCRCGGIATEFEKKGIEAILVRRLPAAELRSPERWADRLTTQLADLRDLSRQIADRNLAGDDRTDDLEERLRGGEGELCRMVHSARRNLLPEMYTSTIETVLKRRMAVVGAGTAELARALIRSHEKVASCPSADTGSAAP